MREIGKGKKKNKRDIGRVGQIHPWPTNTFTSTLTAQPIRARAPTDGLASSVTRALPFSPLRRPVGPAWQPFTRNHVATQSSRCTRGHLSTPPSHGHDNSRRGIHGEHPLWTPSTLLLARPSSAGHITDQSLRKRKLLGSTAQVMTCAPLPPVFYPLAQTRAPKPVSAAARH